MTAIASRFGTLRGLIRLALSYPQATFLPRTIRTPDPAAIKRLVFVCQGNICRSAFAEIVAERLGLAAASFGLSTDAGKAAHPPATAAAAALGHDLSAHRTTRAQDFIVQPGDLLLAMEVRQLDRLAADPRFADVPRTLLGLWTHPMLPHLHDPFELDDAYMLTCLRRIDVAVSGLADAFPATRS
jgi:protein-tyrosine phosphatase